MRGVIILLLLAGIIAFGCTGGPQGGNETAPNMTNQTNLTPPVEECSGPVCGGDGKTYGTDCDAALAGASVQHEGACEEPPEPQCGDTDSGIDPASAGTVSKGNESHADYCLDDRQLVEYACLDNAMQMTTVQCGQGEVCEGGRCVQKPQQNNTNTTPPVEAGCSGPSQNNVYNRETTTYNGMGYVDACVDYRTLKEYYCKGGKLESINNQCPAGYGCTDGQCNWLQPSCEDTDGGNDTSKRGKVTVLKGYLTVGEYTDECIDEGKVKEYVCLEVGTAQSSEEQCPSGTWCYNDHCIPGECSETDGGENIYKRGTTTDAKGEYQDKCMSDYEVREYYCYGNGAEYDDIDCGDGYICNTDSGRCVEGSID